MSIFLSMPVLFWLFLSRSTSPLKWPIWSSVFAISLPLALYQNTGWEQFSYRFLLDILPYLMVALALGSRPFGVWFKIALVWGVLINLLGAVTFQRPVAKALWSDPQSGWRCPERERYVRLITSTYR